MKKSLLILCLSLITTSAFANGFPVLKDSKLGVFKGRDIIRECSLTLEENRDGEIVATFSKDGLIHKSKPLPPEMQIMVSSNNQVWIDFNIEGTSMTHVNLMFDNEYDLNPDSFVVIEGRGNRIYKCRNLKSL